MRERIAERLVNLYEQHDGPLDGLTEADAVLEVMQKWTPEMHTAGLMKFAEMHGRSPSTQLLNSYYAMIQAARDGK